MSTTATRHHDKFDIGRVFGSTFSVIGRNAALCIGLALIFSGLPTLVYLLSFHLIFSGWTAATPDMDAVRAVMSFAPFAVGLANFVLSLILQAALVRAAIEDLNGQKPSFRDCIRTALRLFFPILATAFLVGLGVVLGAILLFVPGIMLFVRWWVAMPALVQERRGVTASIARSRDLTKGNRWRIFGLLLILWLATVGIQVSFAAIAAMFGLIAGAVVATLATTFTSMALSVAAAASYIELRLVKEGAGVDELVDIFS